MSVLSCCNPCSTVQTVNVPGSEGAAGTDGTDGVNAFTTLTADLIIPTAPDTITATVTSSVWMVIGQTLIIGEGLVPSDAPNGWAHFQVTAIPTSTTVTLLPVPQVGDTAGGETLAIGATISPAGQAGV